MSNMPPPLEAIYSSKEELYTSIQAWATQYGYAFSIGRSKKIGFRTKIFYNYDRYGLPPQEPIGGRKSRTASRRTDCLFSIVAVEQSTRQWELRYKEGESIRTHNHPPSDSITSHPTQRKLKQEELNQVKAIYKAGKFKGQYKLNIIY